MLLGVALVMASTMTVPILKVTEDAEIGGNITAENVYLPAYIFCHTNSTMTIASAGVWYNISFDRSPFDNVERINHTYNDGTNSTFTILDAGVYRITWTLSFKDVAASPSNAIISRVVSNGNEIVGSVFEKDSTKQNALGTMTHSILTSLNSGDKIQLQITSDATTVSLGTECTYGEHCDSATISIHKIS